MPTHAPPFSATQIALYTALTTPTLTDGTKASGTLTFTGVVADGQIVTIGTRVYEFDTAVAPGAITAGRVRVDVSGGVTAPQAVTALVAAITGDASAVVTALDGAGDTVAVTATAWGTAPNAYATTTTCANASWAKVTLEGGTVGGTNVGVYSPAPIETASMPYVVIGEDFVQDWSTKSDWGTEHLWRFHIWDKGLSVARAQRIAKTICGRLVNSSLTIGGSSYTLILSRMENAHFFIDEEAGLGEQFAHGVLDIRALVHQV
jgi:hypothetical protein